MRADRLLSALLLLQAHGRLTGRQLPPDFDLAAYWKSSTEEFQDGWPRYEATLRLEPRTAKWVTRWRIAHPVQQVAEPDSAGWATLRVRFDHEDEACFVVLGLGPRADVIEPASLRERVAAQAAAVVARGRQG